MTTRSKLKLCAALLLFSGANISYNGYAERLREDYFNANCLLSDGKITRNEVLTKSTRSRRGIQSEYNVWTFDVEFRQQDGVAVLKTFPVSAEFYQLHTQADKVTNRLVKVRYLANEPYDSARIEERDSQVKMDLIGLFVFCAGLVLTTILWLQARKVAGKPPITG